MHFKSEILGIKVFKKIIFISVNNEILICEIVKSEKEEPKIIIIDRISYEWNNFNIFTGNNYYEIWTGENHKNYIAYIKNNSEIKINEIHENGCKKEEAWGITTNFLNIQNIFFCKLKNSQKNNFLPNNGILFIVDGNGINIKGYSINTEEKKVELICELFRGTTNSIISSIILLTNEIAAVSSSNKTIHLFNIFPSNINNGQLNNIFKIIQNPFNLNRSILKIRIDEIYTNYNIESLFEDDYKKKGNLLIYDEEGKVLQVLGYNGKIYNFDIKDFIKQNSMGYKMKSIIDWSSDEYIEKNNCRSQMLGNEIEILPSSIMIPKEKKSLDEKNNLENIIREKYNIEGDNIDEGISKKEDNEYNESWRLI